MSSPPLHSLTIDQAADLLARREVSSVELTRALLERIQLTDEKLHSFIQITADEALEQAAAADARIAAGQTTPLCGITIGIKDVISVEGQPLTASSKMLANFVSPYDATVTKKLRNAGAVCWGRLNLDEFAMGSSTENSAFHTTSNPYDLDRVPGGSSGGSAAAVAAGEAIATLGSDTGGSIRQPAALTGIVGLKPTYGRVSRFGLIAFASSLDQIGPFTRTIEDNALLMNVISGVDEKDSTSANVATPDFTRDLESVPSGLRIGLAKQYMSDSNTPAVTS